MIRAVLFDCDGVLCDSEPLSFAAWAETLLGYGIRFDPSDHAAAVGTTDRAIARRYAASTGTSAEQLEHEAQKAFLRLVAEGVEVFDDALWLLERARRAGKAVGVASNSDRWRLDAVLGGAGLAGRVPVTVAGDEVPRPKPAPDVYLETARLIGVDPSACLVIEDTPTGISSARAAGMTVVAVDRGVFPSSELAAHLVVDDLRRVPLDG